MAVQGSDLPFFTQEHGYHYARAEYYVQHKIHVDGITHEQTLFGSCYLQVTHSRPQSLRYVWSRGRRNGGLRYAYLIFACKSAVH